MRSSTTKLPEMSVLLNHERSQQTEYSVGRSCRMRQGSIEGNSHAGRSDLVRRGNMSHRPFREISLTAGLTAENCDLPMSRIALYLFEDPLDCQLRSFQCLCEIAGIKE